MPPEDPDHLSTLRDGLRATQEAAQRLVDESRRTPAGGWATPQEAHETTSEVQALLALLRELRDLLPEELREQVTELVRQLLLVVRALIDFVVERIEAGDASGAGGTASREKPVEDIPIA